MNTLIRWTSIGTIFLIAACSTAPPHQTGPMEHFGVDEVTTRELQVIVYGFADQFAGEVELAADQIYSSSNSPYVRENAILWKMNAIPVMYKSAFTPDPLGALLSCWAFCVQMRMYFDTGAGTYVFGEDEHIALDVSRKLEAHISELAEHLMTRGDTLKLRTNLEAYATNNPIENLLFVRPHGSGKFLKATAGGEAVGGLAAAASMNEGMRTLTDRMGILTVSVPKQVQWQTELLMAQTPRLIAEQRDSIIAGFGGGAGPMISFLEKEREIITAFISSERAATLRQLIETRGVVLEAFAEERSAVLQALADERTMTMEMINVLSLATIEAMLEATGKQATAAIDQIFWRTLQVLSVVFVGAFILSFVAMFVIRRIRAPYPVQGRA